MLPLRKLEFVLILLLVIVICAIATTNRWHINLDAGWNSDSPNKTTTTGNTTMTGQESTYRHHELESTAYDKYSDYYLSMPVTRLEFFYTLCNELDIQPEYGPVNFTDIRQGSINARYVYPLVKRNLLFGYTDNTIRPNEFITIYEANTILARAFNNFQNIANDKSSILTHKDMLNLFSFITQNNR